MSDRRIREQISHSISVTDYRTPEAAQRIASQVMADLREEDYVIVSAADVSIALACMQNSNDRGPEFRRLAEALATKPNDLAKA